MELPFDYVMFYLVSVLDIINKILRNKKLSLIYKNLLNLLPYCEEAKCELIEDFYFDYELNNFI